MKINLHGYRFTGFDLPRWCAGVTTLSTSEDHYGQYPVKTISDVMFYPDKTVICCDLLDDDEHLPKRLEVVEDAETPLPVLQAVEPEAGSPPAVLQDKDYPF